MAAIKWYKRDPDAALSGMMELSLEERGAYNTILDLIYSRGGNLPDDDRFLAGWMRCDLRIWRRIKCRLIERGKIAIRDGVVTNLRATSEIDAALCRVESARQAGRISASKSKAKSSEIKEMNPTTVERNPQLTTTTTTTRKSSSTSESDKTAFETIYTETIAIFPRLATSSTMAIYQWLEAGCSLELVLSEIRRCKGKNIGSFAYFTDGIMDAKATLERPPPQGTPRTGGKPEPKRANYKQF